MPGVGEICPKQLLRHRVHFALLGRVERQTMSIERVRQNHGVKLERKPDFLCLIAEILVHRNRLLPAHAVLGGQHVMYVISHISLCIRIKLEASETTSTSSLCAN